jgi:hypothetical protein
MIQIGGCVSFSSQNPYHHHRESTVSLKWKRSVLAAMNRLAKIYSGLIVVHNCRQREERRFRVHICPQLTFFGAWHDQKWASEKWTEFTEIWNRLRICSNVTLSLLFLTITLTLNPPHSHPGWSHSPQVPTTLTQVPTTLYDTEACHIHAGCPHSWCTEHSVEDWVHGI